MGLDLMSNTTDFEKLKTKYNGFVEPAISLSVISKADREKFVVTDLNIELTCGYRANIATVNIFNVYDDDKGKFKDNEFNQIFQIGKKINIEIGYDKTTECVFSGYISGITYNFSDNFMPHLTLECLDVKAAMMANNNNTQLLQDTYSSCINEIVGKSEYKSLYKTADVDSNITSPQGEDKFLVEMADESDYEFVVRIAKKLGYEFFVSQETLYFRKKRLKTDPIMTISHKDLIIDLEANFNISGIVNSVEIRSLDDKTGEMIKATSKSSANYSNSSSASKIISKAERVIIDPTVASDSEAQTRADAELDNLSWRFGTFLIKTVGIPEIIPGRFIKIDGLSSDVNKKVYIVKVIHTINSSGFKTNLEAKLDSL